MLDVLEHIDQEKSSLLSVKRQLKDNGVLILTVPAYPFLWSQHDENACHKRRYTRKSLIKVLEKSGYRIQKISYINTFLFPIICILRCMQNLLKLKDKTHDVPPKWLNIILSKIFMLEGYFLTEMAFPFGLSLFVYAEKNKDVS